VEKLLRWFLPPALRGEDSDAARRAELVVAGCLGTACIALAIAAMQIALGVPQSALAAGLTAAFAAFAALAVRWTGAVHAVAMAVTSVIWCAAFVIAFATDAALAASLFYLALVPALTTLVLGVRSGIACAVATLVALLALLALQPSRPLVHVSAEVARGSAIRGAIVFDFALVLLAGAWEFLRLRSARRAAESEERYRALALLGPDLITEIDACGRIVFASANHDLLGSPTAELLGTDAFSRMHPEDRPVVIEAVTAMRAGGAVHAQPVRGRVASGEWRWFELSLTPFRTQSGERRIVSVARDVTDRLALEARLRQAQKMEAVGQLAGGAAHDFNNLLLVISGYAQQLAEQARPGTDEHAALGEIVTAAERGADVTRRLLALARPAAAARGRVDANAVIADVEQMLRRLVRGDIAVELALAPDLPAVTAEAGQLEQVLVNLALNAADAMPGGGRLRIETRPADGHACIDVVDTGVGMDADTLARAREPFYTTKPAGVGTGLGLYMVDAIVRSLGGSVAIESRPGAGTRVSMVLPGRSTALLPASRADVAPAPRGHEAILVAEDGPEVRAVIERALERTGYRVVVAADGVEALERVEQDPAIALVVSDVVMPRMGGFELVRVLRVRRPKLPVLLVSGHPGEVIGDEGLPAGVELLAKPFSLDELRRRVRLLIDGA
jgi:PAS domain S-box-containing protein